MGGGLTQALDTSIKVVFGNPIPAGSTYNHDGKVYSNYYDVYSNRGIVVKIPFTFTGKIPPDKVLTTIDDLKRQEQYVTGDDSYEANNSGYVGILVLTSSNSGEIRFNIEDSAENMWWQLSYTLVFKKQNFTCEPILLRFTD